MGPEVRNSLLGKKRSGVISVLQSPCRPPGVIEAPSLRLLGGANPLKRRARGRDEQDLFGLKSLGYSERMLVPVTEY